MRSRLAQEDVTRIDTPRARKKEEALSEQVTLPRLPDLEDSGSWEADAPNTAPDMEPDTAPEAAPFEDEEPTIRQVSGRLPEHARMTLTSRHDIDRRALPFSKSEGRDEDEPLELAATVKAPSSGSLELDLEQEPGHELDAARAPISSFPPSSDSPWSSFEVDREALPSSLMPLPIDEPLDEEGTARARRATTILWFAVAAVIAITLAAMLWT